MSIKAPAEKLSYYRFQQWKHDIQFAIVGPRGDFRLEGFEIDGNQRIISGYALDETHGPELITERYNAEEVVELYRI